MKKNNSCQLRHYLYGLQPCLPAVAIAVRQIQAPILPLERQRQFDCQL